VDLKESLPIKKETNPLKTIDTDRSYLHMIQEKDEDMEDIDDL